MKEKIEFIKFFDKYIDYIDIKEESKKGYLRILNEFKKYVMTLSNLPNRGDIVTYRELLRDRLKASSVQKHIVVIRNFYRWYSYEGYGSNVAEGIKGMKIESNFKREALSEEYSKKLLNRAYKKKDKDIVGLRNYGIVALLLTTGLRTIEVERANTEDIGIINDSYVLYVMGKGRDDKDTYVKLSDEVLDILNDYLGERSDSFKPLFINHKDPFTGTRIKTRTIRGVVKDLLVEIGLDSPKYSAHSLRHTAATLALTHGANIEEAQQLLRHKDPKTTQIYIHDIEKSKSNLEEKISNTLFSSIKTRRK